MGSVYLADVFTLQVRLERGPRAELVAWLAGEGMSNRLIADVIGVSDQTVNNDVNAAAKNLAPETVTGRDGKTYQRKPKPPAPQPNVQYTRLGMQ